MIFRTLRALVSYSPNCPKDNEDLVQILTELKDSGYCDMNDRIVEQSKDPDGILSSFWKILVHKLVYNFMKLLLMWAVIAEVRR